MKKLIVVILTTFYMVTSTGASLYLHYCMGKLASWGMVESNNPSCGKCSMKKVQHEEKDGCCNDETKDFKIAKDQKLSSVSLSPESSYLEIAKPGYLSVLLMSFQLPNSVMGNNSAFRSSTIPLHITLCTFLI